MGGVLRKLMGGAAAGLMLAAPCAALAADEAARTRQLCERGSSTAATDPRVQALVAAAHEQHRLFGGQVIDRAGGIVSVGFHEAESDHGKQDSTPTWSRVAGFWAALDKDLPETFTAPGPRRVDRIRLLEQLKALTTPSGAGPVEALDARQLEAIHSSLLRSALIDHPWSAVFISYLVKTAGFSGDEFEFSDSHVAYVKKAFAIDGPESAETPGALANAYAWRACNIKTTRPRPGDLLCHTRGAAAGIDSFAKLAAELRRRDDAGVVSSLPMHCDLVVNADENGNAKLSTIGGNVFQSVTLRYMSLNARKFLGASYFAPALPRDCKATADGCGKGVSRQSWVVLLQSRRR